MNLQFPLGPFGRVGILQRADVHPDLDRFQGKERLGVCTEDLFKELRSAYGNAPFNEAREDKEDDEDGY